MLEGLDAKLLGGRWPPTLAHRESRPAMPKLLQMPVGSARPVAVLSRFSASFCFLALAAVPLAGLAEDARLDFNRDVRPILSENCFSCHGFDAHARQADLRLDTADGAFGPLRGGGAAIVPGRPDESQAWIRIQSDSEWQRMPPPESNLELTATQKEVLGRWIEQGAPYAEHWSFVAPVQPEVPQLPEALAPAQGNEIDAFVRHRLAQERLAPAPEADRYTLIRRVTLDLTGLPPRAEEVEAFVNDPDPRAYERLVERLLESPHFGERMALEWMDAARYADTNGFSIDGGRHNWLWRDWVIQAFNDNQPYDRFLLEQLAGDLLPDATDAQRMATGFQRNAMVTHEGGTIPEENLVNYNADRVKTLGEAVLGLTLACAQCHDHKYDPISQEDYYRLFAYFNTASERGLGGDGGINAAPSIRARTVLRTDEVEPLGRQIAELEEYLATPDPSLLDAWADRLRAESAARGRDLALHPVEVLKVSTPNQGAGFEAEDGNRVRLMAGGLAAFDVAAALPPLDAPITGLRVVVHPLPDLPGGGWGRGLRDEDDHDGRDPRGTFVLTALDATAETLPVDQVDLHRLQAISRVTASSWHADFPPADALDRRNHLGWSPDPAAEGPVQLTATFAQPLDAAATPYLTVQLNFGYGRSMLPELLELFVITGTDDGSTLPADVLELVERPSHDWTDDERRKLWQYCAAQAEQLRRERIELANLRDRLAALTEPFPTLVMDVADEPRATYVLERGDYAQPSERVEPGTPEALPPAPADAPADRLGLAQWVTMPSHPLTARVAVNRTWQMLFGTGIVATPADFGAQGQWPSHPELLDWLAVDFVENGWDVKRLIRQLVTSATYRQSSFTTAEALERDPDNRWLSRGPRFRLPAELIRDLALRASGLLVPRIGGPSVHPYMPGDIWREVSHYGSTPATAQTFVQDRGEKLYRRSLYTYWKRTAPPPNMLAFDAPSREVCTVERTGTTTPLQALVLLNDVQFVEASRAFAERMLARSGSDQDRLRWAFLESVSRPPTPEELAILEAALERERRRYAAAPEQAVLYLSNGESPRDAALGPEQHAAWSQVAALLLNLSETITRN